MTPDERKELDSVHNTIRNINATLKAHQDNLDAHSRSLVAQEGNLAAKEAHLQVLTSFIAASRVMMVATHQVMASNPDLRPAFAAAIESARRDHENTLLFSTTTDQVINDMQAILDGILSPSLQQPPP